jgi:spermidine synthase
MTVAQASPANSSSFEAGRSLPALLLLFIGSGAAALIYEVVWFQLLELVIGSTAVSLGVVLATYMAGLCIGSLALPKYVSSRQHPLRIYALIEVGIAVIGIIVLFAVPLLGRLYSGAGAQGPTGIMLRAIVCAICLLPPTILMGATLPAAARWVESSPRGVSWLGLLYGSNTTGAVLGCLVAGFYLLRVHDMTTATLVAAALNVVVAAIALLLANRTAGGVAGEDGGAASKPALEAPGAWAVYVTIALSGATALGSEVVWTRLLSLMLGASTYTFSIILGVFLAGIALGSAGGSWLARHVDRPQLALGWVQLLQTVGIMWAAIMIANVLPYWPINPSLAPSPWYNLHLDLTKAIWVALPGALLWGASFPLALASVATPGQDPARLVSRVYAANTVGAIVGALLFSLLMIPWRGTHTSQRVLVIAAAFSSILMFLLFVVPPARESKGWPGVRPLARNTGLASIAVALVLGIVLAARVPKIPGLLVAFGRYMVTWMNQVDILFTGEGTNSSIAVTRLLSSGATQFHVAGKVQASALPQDMRLQRMLGHLPALIHPNPKSVLIVGFGAGVTAGTFVPYPDIDSITICEIEPLVPRTSSVYFKEQNRDVFHDRRTQVMYDDARNYVATTKRKFDIITSDPLDPWVKGAATLYTKEHFETIKRHLNPGGVVSQFVQLYESNLAAVKSEIATFLEVFPNGTVWANNINGRGYDLVLLGTVEPTKVDVNGIMARLSRPDYAPVVESMVEVGYQSAVDLFATYAANKNDLVEWLKDAQINRDRNLRLQFIAGLGLNEYNSAGIYDTMARYRKFPDSLFVADEAWLQQVRSAMGLYP